jgi:hypothetical protein
MERGYHKKVNFPLISENFFSKKFVFRSNHPTKALTHRRLEHRNDVQIIERQRLDGNSTGSCVMFGVFFSK